MRLVQLFRKKMNRAKDSGAEEEGRDSRVKEIELRGLGNWMHMCLCVCMGGNVGGDQARKSKEYRMSLGFPGSSSLPLYQFVSICMQFHKCPGINSIYSSIQWKINEKQENCNNLVAKDNQVSELSAAFILKLLKTVFKIISINCNLSFFLFN